MAIVEAFKTCHHYLEGCNHKVLVLTTFVGLWIQRVELSSGQIDPGAIKRSIDEEEKLQAENTQILLRLSELQESDKKARRIGAKGLKDGYKEVDEVLHHQGLSFIPEIIRTEFISRHHNNFLPSHFDIDKTKELIGRIYHWPCLRKDVEAYVKGCNICLSLKSVRHKSYGNLQSLPIPTHQ